MHIFTKCYLKWFMKEQESSKILNFFEWSHWVFNMFKKKNCEMFPLYSKILKMNIFVTIPLQKSHSISSG